MTDPEQFQRLAALYDAVCDATADERESLLASAGAEDPSLRVELEALLAHAPTAARAIGRIIGLGAVQAAQPGLSRLGPYRLERELGRGGMGTVYLARRDDDAYRSRVAIKLLRHGLAAPLAVARFRDERQILATLEHPGIVRLLDGGSTDDGSPYLVMEHVDGVPITQWAETHGLGVAARVELMRRVCEAVAYAHQKLVVHRDLKPSNILVRADGVPKLLDFGIAKLVDPTAEYGREAHTRTGMHLLTPEYASPEQVRGAPASTASDVYSLGVLLYELLAGCLPHRVEGEGLAALRTVLEVEPPRPSSVAPAARRRALVGDLDNIVLKALEKEQARRYASVERLADDLERYLDGRPVLAQPVTLGYRAWKFVRRNRAAVAGLAVVLSSLTAATAVSLQQAQRADENARRADEQARRAQRRFDDVRRLAGSLLFEIHDEIQDLEGATTARELLVGRALEYLDALAVEADDDPSLSRELAAAYLKLGEIQGGSQGPNLGRPADALVSYSKARQILERLVAAGYDDTETRWAQVRALQRLGATGREEALSAALVIIDALPRDAAFDHRLAALLSMTQAQRASLVGDVATTERAARTCLDVANAWAAVDASPDARHWVGIGHAVSALARGHAGDPEGAVRETDQFHAVVAVLASEHPENLTYRNDVGNGLVNAAYYRGEPWHVWKPITGDLAGAEDRLRAALAVFEQGVARDPSDARAVQQVAGTLELLGAAVAERDPAAALPLLQRARDLHASLRASVRDELSAGSHTWFGEWAMGMTLARLGRREDALAALDRALAQATRAGKPEGVEPRMFPPRSRYLVARAHLALGDKTTAARLLDEAAAGLRQTLASPTATIHPLVGLLDTLELLASVRPDRRCEHLREAAIAWNSWPGPATAYTRRRSDALHVARATCPADP